MTDAKRHLLFAPPTYDSRPFADPGRRRMATALRFHDFGHHCGFDLFMRMMTFVDGNNRAVLRKERGRSRSSI